MIKVGMVGLSEGNGHPFSFSAIINGYSDDGLANAGWDVIYQYVRQRDVSEFGFGDVQVTHAWTQDAEQTQRLCKACRIPNAVTSLRDFIGAVDAVILARDDYETHLEMALPLLEAGLCVFVDKPLSLAPEALRAFQPYLERGRLMSCSGLRFARELDEVRANGASYGSIRLIHGTVLNTWEKYGVHILEAVFEAVASMPVAIAPIQANHTSFAITMSDGALFQVDVLGAVPKTFKIDIWGTNRHSSHELADNFSAFRRTLWRFFEMVRTGEPAIAPEETLCVMRLLMAGQIAASENKQVYLDDVKI